MNNTKKQFSVKFPKEISLRSLATPDFVKFVSKNSKINSLSGMPAAPGFISPFGDPEGQKPRSLGPAFHPYNQYLLHRLLSSNSQSFAFSRCASCRPFGPIRGNAGCPEGAPAFVGPRIPVGEQDKTRRTPGSKALWAQSQNAEAALLAFSEEKIMNQKLRRLLNSKVLHKNTVVAPLLGNDSTFCPPGNTGGVVCPSGKERGYDASVVGDCPTGNSPFGASSYSTKRSAVANRRFRTLFSLSDFFPYRKSFLCYWLLPFVGFVYTASALRVAPSEGGFVSGNVTQSHSSVNHSSAFESLGTLKIAGWTETTYSYTNPNVVLKENNWAQKATGGSFVSGYYSDLQNYCRLYLASLERFATQNLNEFALLGLSSSVNTFGTQPLLLSQASGASLPFRTNFGKACKYATVVSKVVTTPLQGPGPAGERGLLSAKMEVLPVKFPFSKFSVGKLLSKIYEVNFTDISQKNVFSPVSWDKPRRGAPTSALPQLSQPPAPEGGRGAAKMSHPLFSYLHASTLLDAFNKQKLIGSLKPLTPYKRVLARDYAGRSFNSNLYEKFFRYENIENLFTTASDERNAFGISVSSSGPSVGTKFIEKMNTSIILKKLFATRLSEISVSKTLNSPQLGLTQDPEGQRNSKLGDTAHEGINYTKLTKDKLYRLLFNSRCFASTFNVLEKEGNNPSHSAQNPIGPEGPAVAESLAKPERLLNPPVNSVKQIYKYTHPLVATGAMDKVESPHSTFLSPFSLSPTQNGRKQGGLTQTKAPMAGSDEVKIPAEFSLTNFTNAQVPKNEPTASGTPLRAQAAGLVGPKGPGTWYGQNDFWSQKNRMKTYTSGVLKDYLVLARLTKINTALDTTQLSPQGTGSKPFSKSGEARLPAIDNNPTPRNSTWDLGQETGYEKNTSQFTLLVAANRSEGHKEATEKVSKVEKLLRAYFSIKNSGSFSPSGSEKQKLQNKLVVNLSKTPSSINNTSLPFGAKGGQSSKISNLSKQLVTRWFEKLGPTGKLKGANSAVSASFSLEGQRGGALLNRQTQFSQGLGSKSGLLTKFTSQNLGQEAIYLNFLASNMGQRFLSQNRSRELNLQSPRLLVKNRLFITAKLDAKNNLTPPKGPSNTSLVEAPLQTVSPAWKESEAAKKVSQYIYDYYSGIYPLINNEVKPVLANTEQNRDITDVTRRVSPLAEELSGPEEVLSLQRRKKAQTKRRIKKLKKETRQRKKRKRFYPRPVWMRYRLYSQEIKKRYYRRKNSEVISTPERNLLGQNTPISGTNFAQRSELPRLFGANSSIVRAGSGPTLHNFQSLDFYTISRPVLGELKRVLWKSYWLRSNLNPYLTKVKSCLKNIKQSQQSWELYTIFQTLVNSFLGARPITSFSGTPFTAQSHVLFAAVVGPSGPFGAPYSEGEERLLLTGNPIQLAEYNRNSYERIQQFISQIRENLTLNGNVKVRASHVGFTPFKEKRRGAIAPGDANVGPTKKNEDFWVKLGKTLTFESHQSSVVAGGEPATANLRLYWAFSKTSYGFFKENHPRKQKWSSTKNREQTKNNKTKKIFRKVATNVQNLFSGSFEDSPPFALDVTHLRTGTTQLSQPLSQAGGPQEGKGDQKLLQKALRKARQKEEKASVFSTLDFANRTAFDSIRLVTASGATQLSQPQFALDVTQGPDVGSGDNRLRNQVSNKLSLSNENKKKKYILNKILLSSSGTHLLGQTSTTYRNVKFPSEISLTEGISFKKTRIKNHRYATKSSYWWTNSLTNSQVFSPALWAAAPEFVLFSTNFNPTLDPFEGTWRSALWAQNHYYISSVLLHFCAIVTILSISRIRSFLKFSLLGISKIYKTAISLFLNWNITPAASSFPSGARRVELPGGQQKAANFAPPEGGAGNTVAPMARGPLANVIRVNPFMNRFTSSAMSKLRSVGGSPSGPNTGVNGPKRRNTNNRSLTKDGYRNASILTARVSRQGRLWRTGIQTKSNPKHFYFFRYLTFMYDSLTKQLGSSLPLFSSQGIQAQMGTDKGEYSKKLQNDGRRPQSFPLRAKLYLFLRYGIQKPIYYFKLAPAYGPSPQLSALRAPPEGVRVSKGSLTSPDLLTGLPNSSKNASLGLGGSNNSFVNYSMLYSLLVMNIVCEKLFTLRYTSAAVLKEVKVNVFEKCLRSVYTFLEKPGEQIVDWVAYMFLVEWASDITNTIPENFDIYLGSTTKKLTRTVFFESLKFSSIAGISPSGPNSPLFKQPVSLSDSFFSTVSQFGLIQLASPFIQRRIYHLYEILLLQFYQPDADLILRQKKGILFWDIWGDFLLQTAEDSNINISELTSVKEEQIKLLEKCETSFMPTGAQEGGFSGPNAKTNGMEKQLMKSGEARLPPLIPAAFSAAVLGNSKKENKFIKLSQIVRSNCQGQSSLPFGSNDSPAVRFALAGRSKTETSGGSAYNDLGDIRSGWGAEGAFGAQQFLSYQGKDTELFIDLHPRGSLADVVSLVKWNDSVQQPIGTLVCQIYSGLLSKQISKNILIVGSSGIEKTLLVQAIAGETELKIITDNAYRYAMVYRGVAVGIKLLRDVFDSLVGAGGPAGPPCLFLIEDIHAIGERRPLLISDDEGLSKNEGASKEIHEKNQVFYQLSKHVITHYKKPYKGDFSLLIPTNHFCFDLFLVRVPSSGASAGGRATGIASRPRKNNAVTPRIPVMEGKKDTASTSGAASDINLANNSDTQNLQQSDNAALGKIPSRLLISSSELLAPPASSPFSFLTLKEEKKFKPLKTVGEMPWGSVAGGSGNLGQDQLAQVSKASYSIRVKVALLADMAISSLSVKLDMITDLLVIIDSVKGNRGFVIFATTHVPYVLDPALRRPGRLDETISLGIAPTLFSRWEFLKSSFSVLNPGIGAPLPLDPLRKNTLDFTLVSKNISNQYNISLMRTKLFNYISPKAHSLTCPPGNAGSPTQLTNASTEYIDNFQRQGKLTVSSVFETTYSSVANALLGKFNKENLTRVDASGTSPRLKQNTYSIVHKTSRKILSQTYFGASVLLIQNSLGAVPLLPFGSGGTAGGPSVVPGGHDKGGPVLHYLELTSSFFNENSRVINSAGISPQQLKKHLIYLISGKLGEMFLFAKADGRQSQCLKELRDARMTAASASLQNRLATIGGRPEVASSFGLSNTWQSLTSLVLSYIQKRYIWNKNLIVPKLLSFSNYSALLEYPSPPSTNILLPAKRYENYKRSFSFFAVKRYSSINIREKINLHQQQRLVKRLYRQPVQELFRSEIMENRFTSFTNAGLMIGSYEPILQKPSSSNWFVKNRILMRHRNSLTNQWWNGQLPEHNAETTFLSDIDWRYTFISQPNISSPQKVGTTGAEGVKDILLDFPDTDQHYNPRNRRWLLTKGSYNNWFDFEKTINSEIYSHFVFDSFVKAYQVFEKNREILDFYAFYGLKNPTAMKRTESVLKLYLLKLQR
uniref:Cell division protein n=1 Tax=Chlamydomonas leiostraca TaxID=1034604 RepID=A0A1L2M595_9CHLO|nr:cell division protein [Chlamydomonas leiostraca]APD80601.1 cell division protein [Chlamydomonas leiostraca]